MKYRKIVIFFMLMLGAAAFCMTKVRPGQQGFSFAAGQGVQAASDIGKEREEESKKIAVVNLDEGVQKDGDQINYAEKLSRFPTLDFEYSSLEAARVGLETGRYGAYIIIPTAFSQNVESINTEPQISQLKYAVNRSYSGEGQYELLYDVRNYIDSLNSRLSYMYVENILKEFHRAQDGAYSVMENDLRDKVAMEKMELQDLEVLKEIPGLQMKEDEIKMLDLSGYADKNIRLEKALKEEYEKSIQIAQEEISSLCAESAVVSGQLDDLSAQVSELVLTVDENGENTVEKADGLLREELENQWRSLLEDENVELDIDGICELVRKEYVEPIELRADKAKEILQQRCEEEITVISSYRRRLEQFQPQIDSQFISRNTDEMADNQASMQNALSENHQACVEYAKESAAIAVKYADSLQEQIMEMKRTSEDMAKKRLQEAQRIKKETSSANQKILGNFVSKLPYTRLGRAEYTQVYQFIANPVEAADCSESRKEDKILTWAKAGEKNQATEETLSQPAAGNRGKKRVLRMTVYAVSGILFVVLSVEIYLFIRRKKSHEY